MQKKTKQTNIQDEFLMGDEIFLRDFFENSPIGFHVFGPDKIIQAINQAELNLLGYKREEIVGHKKWSDLIIPEQRPRFERHWKDISTVGWVKDLRYTLQTKTGPKVPVILNASARFDSAGQFINTRGIVLDMSYFNRSYESLQNLTDTLQQQKLTLEQHNQALNAILANIEIEKEKLKKSVMANLEQLILPVLKNLKRRGNSLDLRYVELLEKNFLSLTSAFGNKLMNPDWNLTPREMEVCNMIKNRLSTKSIADILCVSHRTVEHHRDHIRKKLGLAQSDVNLIGYLQSL